MPSQGNGGVARLGYVMTYWIVGHDYREGHLPTRDAALRALDAGMKSAAA